MCSSNHLHRKPFWSWHFYYLTLPSYTFIHHLSLYCLCHFLLDPTDINLHFVQYPVVLFLFISSGTTNRFDNRLLPAGFQLTKPVALSVSAFTGLPIVYHRCAFNAYGTRLPVHKEVKELKRIQKAHIKIPGELRVHGASPASPQCWLE